MTSALKAEVSDPTWERLEEQLKFYDDGAGRNRRAYLVMKVIQLVVAAAIPVAAAADGSALLLGALGGLVVVFEGVQQLFQFQQNWIGYRTTAEALKKEKYLFLAEAGDYATVPQPRRLLAERVENLATEENSGWAATRRDPKSSQVPLTLESETSKPVVHG